MLFSLIELSARGSTLKARCLPPPPPQCPLPSPVVPCRPLSSPGCLLSYLYPRFSAFLCLALPHSSTGRSVGPLPPLPLFYLFLFCVESCPRPVSLLPLFDESSSIHISRRGALGFAALALCSLFQRSMPRTPARFTLVTRN